MKLSNLKFRLKPEASALPVMSGGWRNDKQTSGQRGYNYRWQQESKAYLRAHPLCVYCLREQRATQATVVDHIIPHQGDQVLFWDQSNWQSMCKPCHDSVKAKEEGRGGSFPY